MPREYYVPESVRGMCAWDPHTLRFEQDLDFPIVGMSDVMPYASTRFSDLSPDQIRDYEQCFAQVLEQAVEKWSPDIIHSNHLWLLTSLACRIFPDIPGW